jgi:hypothetical protein
VKNETTSTERRPIGKAWRFMNSVSLDAHTETIRDVIQYAKDLTKTTTAKTTPTVTSKKGIKRQQ